MDTFETKTRPVIAQYEEKGMMVTEIDASQSVDEVYERVKESIYYERMRKTAS